MFSNSIQLKFVAFLAFLFSTAIIAITKYFTLDLITSEHLKSKLNQEHNETECKNRTIYEFPQDFLTNEQRKHGGIIIHVLITLYLFAALATVCDEYFVQSLSRISRDLRIKDEIAGATFMAVGSSIAELFTSLIGTFIAKSDVGTGAIVGSAVFNLLFVIGICCLVAKSNLKIDWFPITRDSIFYALAVLCLIVTLYDNLIIWYEASILLVLYGLYIVLIYYSQRIEVWIKSKINLFFGGSSYSSIEREDIRLIDPDQTDSPFVRPRSVLFFDDDEDTEPLNLFKAPKKIWLKALWIILFPANMLFYFTIPDCRRDKIKKFPFYLLTFMMSAIYLGILSYLIVWMIVIIAFTVNIPDTVAGLTLLAAGTSIPEVVSSIIITRKGKGDMVVSNSVGSNLFDILVGLGLPWLLSNLFISKTSSIKIESKGIFYSTSVLLLTVLLTFALIIITKFKLDKKLGFILISFWIIVTIINCLFEFDIFGDFAVPFCD